MRIIPKANTLRKRHTFIQRHLLLQRGFGVHSLCSANLITKVIEERCQYYSFYDIELIRRSCFSKMTRSLIPTASKRGRCAAARSAGDCRTRRIRPKHGALLFRLANYFKSKTHPSVRPFHGPVHFVSDSYASDLKCIALENVPEFAPSPVSLSAKPPVTRSTCVGRYKDLLPKALKDMEQLDFVFFNTLYEQQTISGCLRNAETCARRYGLCFRRHQNQPQNARILAGSMLSSRSNGDDRPVFNGNRFFNKKLHKRDYIVYFDSLSKDTNKLIFDLYIRLSPHRLQCWI